MPKDIPEAEIVSQPEGFKYKYQYKEYSETTKKVSKFAWIVSLLSLVFSIVPVFGFAFALFALVIAAIKKVPLFIPFVSLFIASFVTSFVLFIAWLISLIF
jgi:hypothetical protein